MQFYLVRNSGDSKADICDCQIHNWRWQLFKYNTIISILMQNKKYFNWAPRKRFKIAKNKYHENWSIGALLLH